jgi:hypothetical protein
MRGVQEWREPVLTITGPFILGPVLKGRRRIKPPPAFMLLLSAVAAATGIMFVILAYRL